MKKSIRQVNDLKKIPDFEVVKVFSEKISGFSKSINERTALQNALKFVEKNNIPCIMVHEVSRLGRNTTEVLNLIRELETKGISLYIHNLGCTLSNDGAKDQIFTKLIVTIMADLARLESDQLSQRIKSGIRTRKIKGLHTGRKPDSRESTERFLSKHQDIIKYLKLGRSYNEISKLCGCSMSTVKKVKDKMNYS